MDIEDVAPLQVYENESLLPDTWEGSSTPESLLYNGLERTISTWRLIILTIGALGLQSVWSMVMSNGTPHFMYIGLSPTVISLIWLVGPIMGTFYQPYVGALSDNSRHPWGKRKYFIITGTAASIFSLLLFRGSIDLATYWAEVRGLDSRGKEAKVAVKTISVLSIVIFNIAISPVQAALRAFIMESCPSHQQEQASAWVSRFMGIGGILANALSYTSLPDRLSWLGDTQFKALCLFACLALGITISITCVFVKEIPSTMDERTPIKRQTFLEPFARILLSLTGLSGRVKRTMAAKFCEWYSWFAFLYYITSAVGKLYVNHTLSTGIDYTEEEKQDIVDQGTMIGSLAMFLFATVAMAGTILLPVILHPTQSSTERIRGNTSSSSFCFGLRGARHLTITRGWAYSQLLLGLCMFAISFITSYRVAVALVGLMGVSWASTQWIPLAVISAELASNKMRQGSPDPGRQGDENVGAVMGIYNAAISLPQIIAALVCGLLFSILEAFDASGQMRFVLGVSGLPAFWGAYLAYKL